MGGHRAEDPVADDQRQREDRPVLERLQMRAPAGRQRDPGVREDVGRAHRAALAHGETDGPDVTRERAVPVDLFPGAGQQHEIPVLGVDLVERGHASAEQAAQALDDALADLGGLE